MMYTKTIIVNLNGSSHDLIKIYTEVANIQEPSCANGTTKSEPKPDKELQLASTTYGGRFLVLLGTVRRDAGTKTECGKFVM